MKDVLHITAAHPHHYMLDMLRESSIRNGMSFEHLPKHWSYQEFGKIGKVHVLNAYLQSGLIADDQVILFTDAYDVIIGAHAEVILDRFKSFDCGVVFGTEVNFFPNIDREHLKSEFDVSKSKWRYLNSGGYIGYAGHIKTMIADIVGSILAGKHNYKIPDDQALVQDYFLEHRSIPPVLQLDYECEIFCSLNSSVDNYSYKKGALMNDVSRLPSCVLHLNGEKGDLPVLTRYDLMVKSAASFGFIPDLRIAWDADYGPLYYSSSENSLVFGSHPLKERVIFLVKGDLRAIPIPFEQKGYLTFNPNGVVTCNASRLRSWELLHNQNGKWCNAHSQPLSGHIKSLEAKALQLKPLPARYFLDADFEEVIQRIINVYPQV